MNRSGMSVLRSIRFRSAMLGITFGMALGLAAMTAGQSAAASQSVLRIAMTAADIPDWRGQPDQGFEGNRFVGFSLYDTLIEWDLSSREKEVGLRPGLATSWSIDPADHKKWIFNLREGVKFHDGCDWNAAAAVWNFERLTSDKHPAFTPYNFGRARSRTNNIDRVEKTGDYQVAFYTKTPESLFHFNMPFLFMLSPCAVEKAGNNLDVFAKAPSGTGPYKFVSAVPRERLELAKNDDYWDKNRIPKHDRLVLLPMPEATTRVAALLSGQVDFIEAPPPDAIPALKAAKMQIVTNIYPHTWPYILNVARGPFKDIRVRQAANWAVNRQEMVDLLSGLAQPSSGIYVPQQKYYGKPVEYGFDQKKATALLKEAGCYPCEIMIGISTSGSGQMQPLPMNELIKEQLEAVGFKVKFDTVDWNTLLDVYFKGQEKFPYDGVNFSSGATDPLNFLKGSMTKYKGPVGTNWGWYSNPKVDELAETALNSFDPAVWEPIVTQIHEILVNEARNLFIVSDLNPRAMSPRVKGFVQAQSWFQDITPITVDPK
jgi:peptide/nickel transport system substrate-binding protein